MSDYAIGEEIKVKVGGVTEATQSRSTIEPGSAPKYWKIGNEGFPPALAALIAPSEMAFPSGAESKSWKCLPNPWIFRLTWKPGDVVEFFRLSNAVFTVFTFSNATGPHGIATYAATITPSGAAKSLAPQRFIVSMLNSSGGVIEQLLPQSITIACGEASHTFAWQWQFDADLYDIISGAHFDVTQGTPIAHC